MTKIERKVLRRMEWRAFWLGLTGRPLPSSEALLKEFHERVNKEMKA